MQLNMICYLLTTFQVTTRCNASILQQCAGVPMSFLLTRGQSIKVFSQLLRKARQKGLVIPFMKVCWQPRVPLFQFMYVKYFATKAHFVMYDKLCEVALDLWCSPKEGIRMR
jgi:hypothetical protein